MGCVIRLFKHFHDSPTKVGQAVGETKQAVILWRKRGRIPSRAASAVEAATAGKITAREINEENAGKDQEKLELRRALSAGAK